MLPLAPPRIPVLSSCPFPDDDEDNDHNDDDDDGDEGVLILWATVTRAEHKKNPNILVCGFI